MEDHSGFRLLGPIDYNGYGAYGVGVISGSTIYASGIISGAGIISNTISGSKLRISGLIICPGLSGSAISSSGTISGQKIICQDYLETNMQFASTRRCRIGGLPGVEGDYAGIWLATASPSASNYAFLGTGAQTLFNTANLGIADNEFRIGNAVHLTIGVSGAIINGVNDTNNLNGLLMIRNFARNSDILNLDYNGNLKLSGSIIVMSGANISANGLISGGNIYSRGSISGTNIYANNGIISVGQISGTSLYSGNGLNGTFNFGGAVLSGDVSSLTFTGGIATGISQVP